MKSILFLLLGVLLFSVHSLAWEAGPTGVCSDAYGNRVPCDSGGYDSSSSGGDDSGSSSGSTSGDSWDTWGSGGRDSWDSWGEGSAGNPHGSSSSTYTGPTWQERQQWKRESTGLSLNEKGNQYFNSGDFEAAVNYYRQALGYKPDDQVIADNLFRAEGSYLNVQGNKEYEKGNYAAAADYYRQALQRKPESEVIKNNLANAENLVSQQKEWEQEKVELEEKRQQHERRMAVVKEGVSDAVANIARELTPRTTTQNEGLQFMTPSGQLKSAQVHSRQAAAASNIEVMKEESSKGFDTVGVPKEGLKPLDLKGMPLESRDPVVPSELRTPKITQFEKERNEVRNKRWEMEKKLETLQSSPKLDTKKIAELKQEISNAENKENFLNFSINDELRKAPQVKKETPKK
jgi:tetratricopeptide (TPR) repeat protein